MANEHATFPTAPTAQVIAQLAAWFEDYEHHPRKGLGMRSPRELPEAVSEWRSDTAVASY